MPARRPLRPCRANIILTLPTPAPSGTRPHHAMPGTARYRYCNWDSSFVPQPSPAPLNCESQNRSRQLFRLWAAGMQHLVSLPAVVTRAALGSAEGGERGFSGIAFSCAPSHELPVARDRPPLRRHR